MNAAVVVKTLTAYVCAGQAQSSRTGSGTRTQGRHKVGQPMSFVYSEGALAETVRHELHVMAAFWAMLAGPTSATWLQYISIHAQNCLCGQNDSFLSLSKTDGQPVSQEQPSKASWRPWPPVPKHVCMLRWGGTLYMFRSHPHAHRPCRPPSPSVVVFALLQTAHRPCMCCDAIQ